MLNPNKSIKIHMESMSWIDLDLSWCIQRLTIPCITLDDELFCTAAQLRTQSIESVAELVWCFSCFQMSIVLIFSDVCLIFNIRNEVLTFSFFKRNEDVCQPRAESDGISFSFSRSNVLEQNRGSKFRLSVVNRMFERFWAVPFQRTGMIKYAFSNVSEW